MVSRPYAYLYVFSPLTPTRSVCRRLRSNPEIVNQIVEAVTPYAPAIWSAGSVAAQKAAEEIGKGALGKLGGELFSRLRGKSKGAPTDRSELERIVREVMAEDPAFAQQVQVQFQGPVSVGGHAIQVHGPAHFDFGGAGAATAPVAPAPTPLSLHRALPADLPDFTGREDQIAQLETLLRRREGAAISAIGGMGGVGKTALAIQVAHRVKGDFPDGQVLVNLRGFDREHKPLTWAEAMRQVLAWLAPDAKPPDDEDQLLAAYHGLFEGKRVLLLADNAAKAAQVRPLVPAPPSAMVVTSRRTIQLAGLEGMNLDALSTKEADQLLVEIIGAERSKPVERATIAELCGRLPLALRVAANFLKTHETWTAAEYIEALRERRKRLRHDDLDVRATLSLSVGELERESPTRAERWRMLAVFPTSFLRDAAAAVWDITSDSARDDLDTLVERSLLQFGKDEGRFRLHDLFRDLAREELSGEQAEEAAARHAGHYAKVAALADDTYEKGGENVLAGLRLFDNDRAQIEAGQAWAAARRSQRDDAARLSYDYALRAPYVLALRLSARELISWLEAAVEGARHIGDRRSQANALGNLGNAYGALGETRRAIEFHEQRLAIARKIGDRRGEGQSLGNLGGAYRALGETRRAIEFYEQDLEIAREIGDRRGEGQTLGNLGSAYGDLGETRRAIEFSEQYLEIAREIGDRSGEGNALGNLGLAYAGLGETRRAIESYEQSLEIAREIGDRRGKGTTLYNLAGELAKVGRRDEAIDAIEESIRIMEEMEDPWLPKARARLKRLHGE